MLTSNCPPDYVTPDFLLFTTESAQSPKKLYTGNNLIRCHRKERKWRTQ